MSDPKKKPMTVQINDLPAGTSFELPRGDYIGDDLVSEHFEGKFRIRKFSDGRTEVMGNLSKEEMALFTAEDVEGEISLVQLSESGDFHGSKTGKSDLEHLMDTIAEQFPSRDELANEPEKIRGLWNQVWRLGYACFYTSHNLAPGSGREAAYLGIKLGMAFQQALLASAEERTKRDAKRAANVGKHNATATEEKRRNAERAKQLFDEYQASGKDKSSSVRLISKAIGKSERTVRRYLKDN